MSKRFFTSDWHLNHSNILKYYNRQFKSITRMNEVLISNANQSASEKDIIIHVGDLYCYGSDRGSESIKIDPFEYINKINATFINIRGNHDKNNHILSIADDLITKIGPYYNCHVTHFPSNDHNSRVYYKKNIINICGHVHNRWKYFYDKERNILNINVGIDAWKYHLVSESDLIGYISSLSKYPQIKKLLKDRS